MKSSLGKYVVFILAVLLGIFGYCVFDYIDTNVYNGVYPIGKFICISLGLLPVMIYDIAKTKKIKSLIFPVVCIGAVCAWFYFTLPQITYNEAKDKLSKNYTSVVITSKDYDNKELLGDKIPAYYSGAYIFEVEKGAKEYFVVVNPKNGKSYEFEFESHKSMADYFGKTL